MWEKSVNASMTTDGAILTIISKNFNKIFQSAAGCYKNVPLPLNSVQKYNGHSVCKETARTGKKGQKTFFLSKQQEMKTGLRVGPHL